MGKLIKFVLIVVLVFGSYHFYSNSKTSDNPLIGTWKSDKKASMREALKVGVTKQQKKLLSSLYGQMTMEIGENNYKTTLNGEVTKGEYTWEPTSDNCFKIKMEAGTKEVCIKNQALYVPSGFNNAKEVFIKI